MDSANSVAPITQLSPQLVKADTGAQPVAASHNNQAIDEIVSRLNDTLSTSNVDLSFSVDRSSHQVVVEVKDAKTGEVIRQIPSDEMLRVAQNIQTMVGILLDHPV